MCPSPFSSELDESSASGMQRDVRPAAIRRCSSTLQWCCVCFAVHTTDCSLHPNRALRCVAFHTSCRRRCVSAPRRCIATLLVGLQRLSALRSESLSVAEIRGILVGRDSFYLVGWSSRSRRGVRTGRRRLPSGDQGAPTNVYCGSSVAALRPSAASSSSGNGGVRNPASTARCATLSNRRIAVLAALARVSVAISA